VAHPAAARLITLNANVQIAFGDAASCAKPLKLNVAGNVVLSVAGAAHLSLAFLVHGLPLKLL
jgi:hypothetical protein